MSASPLKLVVAFQPGPGHASRLGAVAAALKERGHVVTLATSAAYRESLKNVPHDEFVAVGPPWVEDHVEPTSGTDDADGLRRRAGDIVERFFRGAGEVARDLITACDGGLSPDGFVFDHTLLGGPPAAETLGIPWVAVFGLTVPFQPPGWPPFGSHLPYASSIADRRRYAAMKRYVAWENRELYRPLVRLWQSAGQRIRNIWDPYVRRARLGIVGSVSECDFPLPSGFARRVRYVGPLFDMREHETLDPETRSFLDGAAGPMIHVTLGLTFSRATQTLETILAGTDDPAWHVLVATGHVDAPRSRPRMLARRWLPHVRVFPALDVLICHGGANTLMKALHYGVPTLVVPLGAEQRSNGARVVHAGLGRMLLPDELTADRVRRAIRELLRDPIRHRSRRLGEQARCLGGPRLAAELIEVSIDRERERSKCSSGRLVNRRQGGPPLLR